MKIEKYDGYLGEEMEPGTSVLDVNRRQFLQITGAGIFIFFTIGDLEAIVQRRRRDYPADFNAYLRIGEDGRVSCFTGKIEMGQGIITSLAQMLAEELDVVLDHVDMVMGDTRLCPYDGGTTGSRSTKYFGPPLRKAAAEARAVLLELASEQLSLSIDNLVVKDGIVQDKQGQKKISYAKLTHGRKIERHLPDISIKRKSEYTVSGKTTLKTDSLKKVTGEAKFTADIQLPGMLYAKILRPPAHDAELKSVDVSDAEKIPGVKIVNEGDLVAALHEYPEEAERALNLIKAEFEESTLNIDNENIFEHLQNLNSSTNVVSKEGNIETGRKNSEKKIDSVFYNHYVAHAPMEPHTVVANITNDEVKVWASTQVPFRAQSLVAETLNVPTDKVRIIPPFLGGGYGGKKAGLDIVQTALLAKFTNKPVQLALTRKEEFFYDAFRPAAVIRLKSGINSANEITYWEYDNFFAGSRSSEPIYNIPHYLVQSRRAREGETIHPFATGAWRGPGSNTNVFAMESQTDIMAQAAGMDPLSFRLKNLSDQRMIRVLKAAADKFGHSFSKGPSGNGFGIACTDYLNTYVATMAQVKVEKVTGNVQVERLVCAQDMGEIINPQGAELQIEGGLIMGLGYALSEEILFKGGKILQENFDNYEIARFSWVPKVDVVLVNNPELAPQGCGEPSVTTAGAVIANAIYDAIGARLYTLPMTPERIKNAI